MKKIIYLVVLFLTLLSFHSCKDDCQNPRDPDCENYNPCTDAKQTSAAFTIKEARYTEIIEPRLADFLMDTDSCYARSIYFEALQLDADSYIWQIGSEIQPRYGKQVNVVFPDNLRGTTFTIQLIVKRKPNTSCFPNDDGIDTLTRKFYYVKFNEPLSWEGTYVGSDDDKPDSMYTIVLGHSYDVAEQEDILKVFGIPRGCKDTINEYFSSRLITYRNSRFDRGGLDCDSKTVRGIFRNGNTYLIRQEYPTFINGVFTIKNRVFTGNKIN
jgi:hypothetical protein